MRLVLLLLAMLVAVPQSYAVPLDQASASYKQCECPPDCDCHKLGHSCPDEECIEGCECFKNQLSGGMFIPPQMVEAILANERLRASGGDISGRADFIWVNGKKQFTGFRPTREFYEGQESINIVVPEDYVMKDVDYSKDGSIHINRQVEGSCWAEGCGTVVTAAVNAPGFRAFTSFDGLIFMSVQDVIDCSGFGTARGGGQLSVSYAADKGLATTQAYPYNGHDNRCVKDVKRYKFLENAPMWRGATDGMPTEREYNYALNMLGPEEVCGCAGALKGGGLHTEMPSSCGTNHCYGHVGMRYDPVLKIWLHKIANSWGEDWGDKGYGEYRLAKTPGGKISGSIIVEGQGAHTGKPPFLPPKPIVFDLLVAQWALHIVISPEAQAKWKQDSLSQALTAAYAE